MSRPYAFLLFVTLFLASVAQAQSNRTFVSVSGSDASSCSVAAPCRSFAAALALTSDGGEIIVLTSGGYGPVTITKSVQITAPAGIYAGITAGSGSGILVDAPGGTVKVRGLSLNGRGAWEGMTIVAAAAFEVSDSTINGFSEYGLRASLTTSGTDVSVHNTVFNGNAAATFFTTSVGTIFASIDHSRAERNNVGFWAYENARVMVSNSVASHNGWGYYSSSQTQSHPAELNAESCVAHNNVSAGFYSFNQGGPAMTRVTRSSATNNGYGLHNNGGVMESAGDNMVRGNTSANTLGTITAVPHI